MSSDEDKAERRRCWKRDLLSIGARSPDGNGTVSSGVLHAWMELGDTLLEQEVVDEKFLVDTVYLLARSREKG